MWIHDLLSHFQFYTTTSNNIGKKTKTKQVKTFNERVLYQRE